MRTLRPAGIVCGLLLLSACIRSHALTKILVVPTARTIGARRYAIELDRKDQLFSTALHRITITGKFGLGGRGQFEIKRPVGGGGEAITLNGKYTFAASDDGKTMAAIGFEDLGSSSRITPYTALSHQFRSVDLTVGVAREADSLIVWFTGVDYRPLERLHILADCSTGRRDSASFGYQYDFGRHWSVKSGLEAERNARANLLIKISYGSRY